MLSVFEVTEVHGIFFLRLFLQVAVASRSAGEGRQFKTGTKAVPAYLHPASVDSKHRSQHT